MLKIIEKYGILKKNFYLALVVGIFSFGVFFDSSQVAFADDDIKIPPWLKTTAVWWGEEKITDPEFVSTLQYLVDKKILIIPEIETPASVCGPGLVLDEDLNECVIPDETDSEIIFADTIEAQQEIVVSWIKLTTLWWGEDKISDQDFINALQYLVENRVLLLEAEEPPKQIFEEKIKPEDLVIWPKIGQIDEFKVQGHPNIEIYNLQFKLLDVNLKPVSADGTVSIAFLDDRNRILYLDAFSVKKSKYVESFDAFDEGDDGKNVYAWEIKSSNIKSGFTPYGKAKLVFTDRYGNNFESQFDRVSIPQFN